MQSQLESIARILQGLKQLQPTQRSTYADAAKKRTYEGGYQRMSATRKPELGNRQMNQRLQGRRPMECWTCGEKGHIARFCKQITCYKCGKRGHVASQCGGQRQNRQIRCLENVEEDWEGDDFTDFENESITQDSLGQRNRI